MPIIPTIVAHRGLHTRAKENSAGAFMAASEAGISWVTLNDPVIPCSR
jgi:glycerophosphoryl diester phosphodiesterase